MTSEPDQNPEPNGVMSLKAIDTSSLKSDDSMPKNIKRYRIKKRLGAGSFGKVFLATDEQLQRDVAIKVPMQKYLSNSNESAQYLSAAQTIAELDHPNIVPIYDVGTTIDFPCYIVTKFIVGENLANVNARHSLTAHDAIKLTIEIAQALHFAHCRGVIHGDIKPKNILLDIDGKAYIADLGLTGHDLTTNSIDTSGAIGYLSPEQARGERKRVDRRSDIFSLGVLLYELLSGKLPFGGSSGSEQLERIANGEPKPLRQIQDAYPLQLERICMKAIAHRVSDRYSTAQDFADELQQFLTESDSSWDERARIQRLDPFGSKRRNDPQQKQSGANPSGRANSTDLGNPQTNQIVPKGIQPFDGHDADFFLELLPGPIDQDGLPEIIRFWKSRLQEPEFSATCPTGILYGPSGCGKTSLIRAGILPRLGDSVSAVFVAATASNTTQALKKKILERFPAIPEGMTLSEIAKGLREKRFSRTDMKVVLVFDQFEQWLNQPKNLQDHEMIDTIRQCDGVNLQSLILVRDEFWLSLTRFAEAIELELQEDVNLTCVDTFPLEHAKKVLHQLGAAYGRLPQFDEQLSSSQSRFLETITDQLADQGRVACVKIALTAELLKARDWSENSISNLGGLKGIGVAYLEQTLNQSNMPSSRFHAAAAQRVLLALTPNDRSTLKAPALGESDLIRLAQYEQKPQDFRELIELLEKETKLISVKDSNALECEFQLTHDYLIPSIRDWSETNERSTVAGRTRLLLKERSDVWNAKPATQRLPSALETWTILRKTNASQRSVAESRMLSQAKKFFLTRIAISLVMIIAVGCIAFSSMNRLKKNANLILQENRTDQARTLIQTIQSLPMSEIVYASENLLPFRDEATSLLSESRDHELSRRERIIRLAMQSAIGNHQHSLLIEMLDNATDEENSLLVKALPNNKEVKRKIATGFASANTLSEKAKFALLAMDFGDTQKIQGLLKIDDDETDRSHVIVAFPNWTHNWQNALKLLNTTQDAGVESGLLLGLSLCDPQEMAYRFRTETIGLAKAKFCSSPSSAVHAAAEKLLLNWNCETPNITGSPVNAQWRITSQGLTLVQVSPGTARVMEHHNPRYQKPGTLQPFLKRNDRKSDQTYSVEKEFWIADREISKELFYQFLNDSTVLPNDRIANWNEERAAFENQKKMNNWQTPGAEHPINNLCGQDAILFCNWLSRKEGLSPVYSRTGKFFQVKNKGEYSYKSQLLEWDSWTPDYSKNGYRLPSLPEFNLARIGESTNFFSFGDDLFLTEHFVNVSKDAPAPLNLMYTWKCYDGLPNNRGIYNLFGNVAELGHYAPLIQASPQHYDWQPKTVNEEVGQILGGGMNKRRRDANFRGSTTGAGNRRYGFRVVRQKNQQEQ